MVPSSVRIEDVNRRSRREQPPIVINASACRLSQRSEKLEEFALHATVPSPIPANTSCFARRPHRDRGKACFRTYTRPPCFRSESDNLISSCGKQDCCLFDLVVLFASGMARQSISSWYCNHGSHLAPQRQRIDQASARKLRQPAFDGLVGRRLHSWGIVGADARS